MSPASLVIVGEVFLVLIVIAGFLFYYLNNLNNQLFEQNQKLKKSLKDEKRHAKGLRVKIQELTEKANQIQSEFDAYKAENDSSAEDKSSLQAEYQALQIQLTELETEKKKLDKQFSKLQKQAQKKQSQIDELEAQLESEKKKAISLQQEAHASNKDDDIDYESMYHDLRNSIAFNMEGGKDYLDVLKERLLENGNTEESDQLEALKERYNSVGEMVGLVSDVEFFNEEDDEAEKQRELEKINLAEGAVDEANRLLMEAQGQDKTVCDIGSNEQESLMFLRRDLSESNLMNQRLRSKLDKTTTQLMAFVKKARVFQAQKEQIKMHKATESQMHRNFVNLNAEFKQVSRKYKTLNSRNEILNAQLKSSLDNSEKVARLEEMTQQLEAKEQAMDRMIIEKDMLEQQFLTMSKESDIEAESSEALARLQSEHRLLEQQFMEVLNELDTEHKNETMADNGIALESEDKTDDVQEDLSGVEAVSQLEE